MATSLSLLRLAVSVFVAGGVAYGLAKMGNFSWIQIVAISVGAATFLFVYGKVTSQWYLQKGQNRISSVMKRRIRITLGVYVIMIFVLIISGGIQDRVQIVDLFLLGLTVSVLWFLLARFFHD